ncbi:Alpha/Beta hydrolase protein [Penicillium malachiteum]|uniref:Alpha/Beta hydrolase protein n=1 Tax=Penicillium malachiteum TaxID=1324776 RepID=UPI002548E815|nr:Alpha/Beta hydrolase protein [Penicillium malachiteum]KAJ5736830.1 Alpha/Beta hydrolase protein [Penicillium malachiteum]
MATYDFISLATKPSAKICYKFYPSVKTTKPVLLVFVNPMGLTQTSWENVITRLHKNAPNGGVPAMLTYDRYGQGQTTDRDPSDANAVDKRHGHDCLDVVHDLHQLITQIADQDMGISDIGQLQLVFVANSIGGALTRLYAQEYPGSVAGLLLLDSVLANTDFVSIFPDPDACDFDKSTLPVVVEVEDIRASRAFAQRVFHPSNGSDEGLSRKNLSALLPYSDGPQLQGPDGRGPWVTVVGHEWEASEREQEAMGAPGLVTRMYSNPFWSAYNEGLAKITEPERSKGPFQALGAGHFIQRDNPELVEGEIRDILDKVL